MKSWLRVLSLLALGSLGACASGPLGPFGKPNDIGARMNSPRLPNMAPYARQADTVGGTARRDYARILLAQSDILCEDYLVGVSYQRNTGTSGLSIAALALSTAGTVTTPVRNAQLLSGVSSILQGTRTTLNDTLF